MGFQPFEDQKKSEPQNCAFPFYRDPMFYVLILKEILKEDMPEKLPDPVAKSIMEFHA